MRIAAVGLFLILGACAGSPPCSAVDSGNNNGTDGGSCPSGSIPKKSGGCFDPSGATLAAWEFNEGSGTSAKDTAHPGHDGVLCAFPTGSDLSYPDGGCMAGGGPMWVTARGSGALQFDGVSQGVATPDDGTLHVPTISIEAYVQWGGATAVQQRIVERSRASSSGTNAIFGLSLSATGAIVMEVRPSYNNDSQVAVSTQSTQNVTPAEWTHVVGTYDGLTVVLYKNGVEVGRSALSSTGPILYSEERQEGFGIGNQWTRNRGFKGSIDYVRLYDRRLTADEVTALYDAEKAR